MSYDIRIKNKATDETISLSNKHNIVGSTYCLGGINECILNITYNYQPIFARLFGEKGIRTLYNCDILETRSQLIDAMLSLKEDDDNPGYWICTEGNVKKALKNLIDLADLAMAEYPEIEMVWDGD